MVKLCVWSPNYGVTRPSEAQPKIDVVESDRKLLRIETANLKKDIAPHHHACGGHGRELLGDRRSTEIARLATTEPRMNVGGKAAYTHHDSCMLDRVIWI